jgi:SAM-dependent methyltransferase
MKPRFLRTPAALAGLCFCLALAAHAAAQPFEPVSGQAGKDVVWVPTPPALVEKMLDLAQVTPRDFVMDLGSGDGRNVIAAARRGARAVGVEYNPDMVAYARREAEKAGVAGKAQFVQGDMFEADISQATVLALFLLPDNLDKLVGKFLELKPGTRIVLNTFGIRHWEPDETALGDDCGAWCNVLLYVVPARVAGDWDFMDGRLHLDQSYQVVSGSYRTAAGTMPIADVRLRGDRLSFSVDGSEYNGIVEGDSIRAAGGGSWIARRGVPR